jgi:holo-[acyl-carrier protein] synthase
VDIVQVSRVLRLIGGATSGCINLMLTKDELCACSVGPLLDEQAVSGRLALKEAVFKSLRCTGRALPWRDIITTGGGESPPAVHLAGVAAGLAERRGIAHFRASVSHDGDYAIAVALAFGH